MNYEEALAWVHSLPRLAPHPGVENTRRLLQKLGDPQKKLCFVHIAGTNGKGSATVMLASVLHEAGLHTGANISPYVLDFCERFQIDGVMIARDTLAEILSEVRAAAAHLTCEGWESIVEFDVVTAAALVWYARQHCEIVCMEVGLGGRLDSTNAIENTLVACIMAIGKDHTELLGDSYAQIATEKCGVFKHNCDVICYPAQPPEAMETIAACAAAAGCVLRVPEMTALVAPPPAAATEMGSTLWKNEVSYHGLPLCIPFAGRHQVYNAMVVVDAARALCTHGFSIPDAAITSGIAAARFPARIEVISRVPLVILDGAHNPDGALALARVLEGAGVSGLVAVVGILQGKEPDAMLRILLPYIKILFTVTPNSPRALEAGQLAKMAAHIACGRETKEIVPCESVAEAVERAKCAAGKDGSGLLVCGSLYLAAEARKLLKA